MALNSARTFIMVWLDGIDNDTTSKKHHLDEIIDNEENWEYLYSVNDEIDELLDLKVGETMYFHPERDDHNSKGVIKRIR